MCVCAYDMKATRNSIPSRDEIRGREMWPWVSVVKVLGVNFCNFVFAGIVL